MGDKVSPELILRQGKELQSIEISDERAGQLAGEVETINSAAREAADELDFDDEPAGFFRVLRQQKPQFDGSEDAGDER